MNLTEPQAGSDLSLVRTKAERSADHYLISGQKIFITYGEHDLAENIVHLVLARTPDAPEGVKGISLFVVPKFLAGGKRNTARCASIEHKLGIHASPTAVMVYDKAVGYVVGEENRGLEYMFIMMNAARFAVGLEGVAIAERAFQRALAFAKERMQGRDLVEGKTVPIIRHPDVRRMLMLMKSQTEAMRALAYVVAAALDFRPQDERRQAAGLRRPDDPGGEGLVDRDRHRRRLARRAGARRHGLHRGDRRRAVPSRRAYHHDLRGHHRHPGDGPGRPQDRPRRRSDRARLAR
jgi:alkylation response protein AidB-like acyl-CoA dehydrogenase